MYIRARHCRYIHHHTYNQSETEVFRLLVFVYFLLLVVSRSLTHSLSRFRSLSAATIAGFAFVSQLTIQPASQSASQIVNSSCTFGVFISNQLVEPTFHFGISDSIVYGFLNLWSKLNFFLRIH